MNYALKCFAKFAFALSTIVFVPPEAALAGGLLGDLVNKVAPGVGTRLDDAHRGIKEAIPPYKAIEEGASHVVQESFVQAGAPALQELIARSRDDALAQGVQPIPDRIRANLQGFIPDNILNIVRFRVKGGGDLTLQVNSIKYGEAQAIALDYIVVFKEENDAFFNPTLWAHELTHIGQYQRWGIGDFAIRYLRSHGDVEREAYEAETRYMAWVGQKNSQVSQGMGQSPSQNALNRPAVAFPQGGASNMCGTAAGVCQMAQQGPAGTPCWCTGPFGAAAGSLIPTGPIQISTPVGLPSGAPMQACGCWGPTPVQVVPEGRCISQSVRLQVCPGLCAPGHPLYGYVCN